MRRLHIVSRERMLALIGSLVIGSSAIAADPAQIAGGEIPEPIMTGSTILPEIRLTIDIAEMLRLHRPASTIVIGNPGIANATLADGRTVVLTGKAAGTTNIIVLSETGTEIAHALLRVGTAQHTEVKVFKGLQRQTYSCTPECAPTIAIGDEDEHFQSVLSQTQTRQGFSGTAGTGSP